MKNNTANKNDTGFYNHVTEHHKRELKKTRGKLVISAVATTVTLATTFMLADMANDDFSNDYRNKIMQEEFAKSIKMQIQEQAIEQAKKQDAYSYDPAKKLEDTRTLSLSVTLDQKDALKKAEERTEQQNQGNKDGTKTLAILFGLLSAGGALSAASQTNDIFKLKKKIKTAPKP